jgi:hypothetical protein
MKTRSWSPRRFAFAAVVTALVLALAPVALAGKGGTHGGGGGGGGTTTTGSGSLSLVMVSQTADGLPHWGSVVTFNISTTISQPWVHLVCKQNGVTVAEGWNGYFVGSLTGTNFGLYSPQWSSGAADCTGYLTTPQWSVLSSTSFHVYA